MFNQRLAQVAQEAIAEACSEGLGDEDAKWMAQGAVIREGRNQGVIGESVSDEMQAVVDVLVQEQWKGKR